MGLPEGDRRCLPPLSSSVGLGLSLVSRSPDYTHANLNVLFMAQRMVSWLPF